MLTLSELQKKDLKTLHMELENARRAYLASKLSVKMDQDKKSHLIRQNKRYIAQILTVLRQQSQSEAATPKTQEKVLQNP